LQYEMICHGLKALAKVIHSGYFAYVNCFSYSEKLLLLGFWHRRGGVGSHYFDSSQNQ
jgi:hypothetical protein